MKTIRFAAIAPKDFRKMVHSPKDISVKDDATIIDLIAAADQEYFSQVVEHPKDFKTVFLDDRMLSFLQMVWDPSTQTFFGDVNIEARTAPPESNSIPIESQWNANLPDGSWVVFTPEIGS